jgi:hypothetical protein
MSDIRQSKPYFANFYTEYEEEIERWKGLYEEQSIKEQELTKNVNKYQVYGTIIEKFVTQLPV